MDDRAAGPQAGHQALATPGTPIRRDRLLEHILAVADPVVVMSAPSGFGKSVLARQLVLAEGFARILWLDLPDQGVTSQVLVEALLDSMGLPANGEPAEPWALRRGLEDGDDSRLAELFRMLRGERVALVLDNLSGDETQCSAAFVRRFLRAVDPSSRVVITTREPAEQAGLASSAVVLGADELRLRPEEANSMVAVLHARALDGGVVDALLTLSAGHVASFAVLARYVSINGVSAIAGRCLPPSLEARLRLAASSHLDDEMRQGLFACALLGSGTERDLLAVLDSTANLGQIAATIPLVTLESYSGRSFAFRCHDLATLAFCSREWADEQVADWPATVDRVLAALDERRDASRALDIVMEFCPDRLPDYLEANGQLCLDKGFFGLLGRALGRLPVGTLLSRPGLLALDASVHLALGDLVEAERKASVARELARHSCEVECEIDALTVIDAVNYLRGDLKASQDSLVSVMGIGGARLTSSSEMLIRSRLVMGFGQLGDLEAASRERSLLDPLVQSADPGCYARTRAELRLATCAGGIEGDVKAGVQQLTDIVTRPEMSAAIRFEAHQNLAGGLVDLGRLDRASRALARAEQLATDYGLDSIVDELGGTRSWLLAASGDEAACTESDCCLGHFVTTANLLNANYHRLYHSLVLGAYGRVESALSCSEESLEYFASRQVVVFTWEATLGVARCLLGLGDAATARSHAGGVLREVAAGYRYHHLLADLVLAEADRVDGIHADGVGRLAAESDYILSENANWTTAMIVRALPGLLGLLSEGVLPERLPLHMLRMVGDDKLDEGLALAAAWMEPGRLGSLESHVSRARKGGGGTAPAARVGCFVRLFGGLEVRTPEVGLVPDSAWKKRKARMLFAMLVARRGQDVPRDVLFEYLWPEMDEERARNNYYVILSAIKRATTGRAERGKAHYIRGSGAMCSIDTATVRSDLDDFDELVAEAHEAEEQPRVGDAIRAYTRLMDVYRGELLPGDLYDDWFAPLRERYRQEFSDAMLRAATLLIDRGDEASALHMLRRALAFDPWREDIYQAALRCQISTGQRSAAVETYVACRARLSEDLGLDPSAETRKLYETILAMEGDGEVV